ncbi:glycerol-3-phosphate dehydrogenase [Dethiosulfatibacter aminovorans DSM 17477]|uniref:Glycerol-3-phosphate dehydrogenase n=1 Tax=Dethiosulfatibacter aminovorans DSM 17477 TaxID=1121476 RepID=A0A1M6KUH8_9FIRM|nr:NAD(P)/FAD-dependent oxidoreductase [Dethiosulfatibacter aminovorans]SHJ62593.1 glycerol-3-phosphate dehydrogenase [Dethiosulfatibacter aminovorans DSM 17477]
MYNVAVIGAGVIGTAIARELSKFDLKIVILERDNDVSSGSTKANSAIIHAGYDAHFDTLKGKMNARGNYLMEDVCNELNVPFKRIGSLVIARSEKEFETVKELYENGLKLEIPGMEIISGEEAMKREPNLAEGVLGALYAPTAGIVEPWELAMAYAENAIDNGAELRLNFEVREIEKKEDCYSVRSEKDSVEAEYVINAAGLYADRIYNMVADSEFEIHPRRGQYYLLDKEAGGLINHVVFPCPNEMGKGTLVAPTIDGNILVGPDSEDLEREDKEAVNTTYDRLDRVKKLAGNISDKIPYKLNITTFAGLRAEPSTDDFIIEESKQAKGFVNAAGMKSPGLSSAPAIAEYVVGIVEKMSGGLQKNENFKPVRRKRIKFEELSDEEKNEMIKKDSRYGRIICRCEMITEGEIVDAIHRSAGGRTVNGIKRRCRPGAGRCQGGFCGPRVMEILARELNVPMEEVLMENKGSVILTGKTKVGG